MLAEIETRGVIAWPNFDRCLIQRPHEAISCDAFTPNPRETRVLIGTKPADISIRPSNLAYGTGFARGKTGKALQKGKIAQI